MIFNVNKEDCWIIAIITAWHEYSWWAIKRHCLNPKQFKNKYEVGMSLPNCSTTDVNMEASYD